MKYLKTHLNPKTHTVELYTTYKFSDITYQNYKRYTLKVKTDKVIQFNTFYLRVYQKSVIFYAVIN